MFNKILATIGIGSATVDTILDNDTLTVGDKISGIIKITGGTVEQELSGLKMALLTKAEVEQGDSEYTTNMILQEWNVEDSYTIQPNEVLEIPFEDKLLLEAPITQNGARYNKVSLWIQTGLEIDLGKDASDIDYIYTTYTPIMEKFMIAMEECGFYLNSADVEKGFIKTPRFSSTSGVYQELEFKQKGIQIFEGYEEIEVSFITEANQTHILLEIDRKYSSRDTYKSLTFPNNFTNTNEIVNQIKNILQI